MGCYWKKFPSLQDPVYKAMEDMQDLHTAFKKDWQNEFQKENDNLKVLFCVGKGEGVKETILY